ncbi:CHASE2 domain-containing protein [Acaryochloris sp. 'Moss Beach']|uniref:CHASE2 domain-containing protein n=1 Tax=Acaryochloris sp. 'Moss Beach' TaxID=2740837 RepID=UPI001F21F32E
MDKLVVLRMGEGSFTQGFPVTLQVGKENDRPSTEIVGFLPPNPNIPQYYQGWQTAYLNLGLTTRLDAPTEQLTNIDWQELQINCEQAAQTLHHALDQWLLADTFRPVRDKWLEQLSLQDHIRIILQTDNPQLQRLPWHQWELLTRYPFAELVLSAPTYEGIQRQSSSTTGIKILAILGSSQGINTQADQGLLNQLPNANVTFLVEPQRQELTDQLWDQNWDILFFAGHSHSSNPCDTGHICLNAHETLNINQLKYALQQAISKGLQLAIFNSCDGLGLAHQLADIHLPAMVIMREPIPDQVAQYFLKYFLTAFSKGKPFHLAVREARERLHDLEPHFPCATWLPIICQNPAEIPPTWQKLSKSDGDDYSLWRHDNDSAAQIVTIVFTDLVSSTAIKQAMPGLDVTTRNHQYYDTILQPHRQRVTASLTAFGGRLVKTEGDGFLISFPGAMQAAQWSIALQQHHEQDPITTPFGPLQVRIGMHTGSPLLKAEDHDYIGQEVDYAYRISDLADGGQILLSEVSAVLLRNAGLTDITVYDHDHCSLKGIGCVPVFEILWDNRQPRPVRDTPSTVSNSRHQDRQSPEVEQTLPTAVAPIVAELPLEKVSLFSKVHRFCHRPLLSALPTSLCLTAAIIGIRGLGILQPIEFWAFDQLLRLRPNEGPDPRLLIVLVTDKDIKAQGDQTKRSSLNDPTLTRLLTQLNKAKPQAIGLDIYRDFTVDPNYPQLATQLKNNERLVVPCKGSDSSSNTDGIAPPTEVQAPNRIGFTDFIEDGDGVLRRHILHMNHEPASPCQASFSFGSLLAFHYLEQQSPQTFSLKFAEPEGHPLELQVQTDQPGTGTTRTTIFKQLQPHGGYQGINDDRMRGLQLMLNYRALKRPTDIAKTVTLEQVLAGQVNANAIKDKVVLVGVQASGSGDFWSTPYGAGPTQKVAGVFVQAHMASQIISAVEDQRSCFKIWPQWADGLWIWGWAMMGGIVAIVFKLTTRTGVISTVLVSGLFSLCLWGLIQAIWMPLIPSLIAFVITTVAVLLVRTKKIDHDHPAS